MSTTSPTTRWLRLLPRWLQRNHQRLQWQITVVLGMAFLITLLIVIVSVAAIVNQSEATTWRSRQTEAAYNAAKTVSEFLQRSQDVLALMSVLGQEELTKHTGFVGDVLNHNPALLEVIGLDASGKVFASAYHDRAVLANLFTIPQSQWFVSAQAGRAYFGDVRLSAGDTPYLIIALPGFEGGVIAARLSMDVMWQVVSNIRFGEAGRAYVIDHNGAIIAYTDPAVVLSNTTLAARSDLAGLLRATDKHWSGTYRNLDGAEVVGVTSPIDGTDWLVVTELPLTEAYAYSRTTVTLLALVLLAVSVAVMALLRFIFQHLVFAPVTRLQIGAERIGQGDLAHRIGLARQDEIGQVARAFDEMARHVQERDQTLTAQAAALAAEIAERQRAGAALQASEQQLRHITDNMFDVISEIDAQGNILYASPSHQWIIGCDPAEVLGQPIYDRLHPDDVVEALGALAEALNSSEQPQSVTFRYQHAAGQYLWMECNATLLHNEAGEPTGAILCSRDVTARKQTERALRDSEARYRAIVEDQTELICRWQPDGTLTFVNEAYCRSFERTRDELIGSNVMLLIPEEDHDLIALSSANFSPDRPVAMYEHRVRSSDGGLRWQAWTDRAIFDDHGQLLEFASVGRDITDRKRAEAEIRSLNADLERRVLERTAQLREAEAKFRLLVEQIPAVTYVSALDTNSSTLYVSPQIETMLGYAQAEWQADPALWRTVLHPDDRDRVLASAARCASRGEPLNQEYRLMARDGRTVWVRDEARLVVDAARQPFHWQGVMYDITDRKRAELRSTAFARLAQRLNATSQPKEAAHIIVDVARSLLGWDACFIDLYSPEKGLILRNVLMMDLIDGQLTEVPILDANYTPTPVVHRTINEGGQLVLLHDWETEHGELQSFGLGEQQTISLLFVPIRHGAHTIGVLSIQSYQPDAYDQSDLDTLQSLADHCGAALERIKVEEQIHASLHEKEVLLKEIHHRVKNNLQVISSLLRLQSRQVTDATTLELLRESQNRVRSMALIHEKLYQSDDLARVDFAEYVRNLASYLFRSYKASPAAISLAIETAPDLRLSLDAAIPCGLIINELVSNALKYAFPDGRAGEVRITFSHAANGRYNLQVRDNGVGIPDGFDFRQSTSLGLQLVNTLIEQLDGSIDLHRNGGTEFVATFRDTRH